MLGIIFTSLGVGVSYSMGIIMWVISYPLFLLVWLEACSYHFWYGCHVLLFEFEFNELVEK